MKRLTVIVLALCLSFVSIEAQVTQPLSSRAQSVKSKVAQLSAGSKISVVRVHAEEEFGTFISSTESEFTFSDIDSKSNVTLRFEDVKKVKAGYGGYNSLHGRHTDHTTAIVVGVVLAGALVGLVAAAASSK